jgi:2-methylisocitrate lyase-like PEP mutase family enzyme
MTTDRRETYERFKALHERPGIFTIPNPWNAGTARVLSGLGFEALATTSAGYALSVGRRDSFGALTRDEVLANAREIVEATDLPVSADLEEGFGPRPEDCAETIRRAAEVGLVGGSIEDATGDPADPIFPFGHAVERIEAASEAAKDLPFLLTARAESFLYGRPDLGDTIARLQAFSKAGAHVLYAPGLPDLESIRAICQAVDKPVNVVMGLNLSRYTLEDLEGAGVKRVSVGGAFARAALGAFLSAAREVRERGSFTFAEAAVPDADVGAFMSQRKRP